MAIRIFPYLMMALCTLGVSSVLHPAGRGTAIWAVPALWTWGLCALWVLQSEESPSLGWTLGLAFGARALLVGTPLDLSDDLYRYLWEGAVMTAGHNPFSEAPVTISGLDDALRDRVNHPDISSIYPPVALFWF